jgi:hypothetical protein
VKHGRTLALQVFLFRRVLSYLDRERMQLQSGEYFPVGAESSDGQPPT